MFLLAHVDKVGFLIVQGVAVYVVANITPWGSGNESVHGDVNVDIIPAYRGFCVPVVVCVDGSPGEFVQGGVTMVINDRYFAPRQLDHCKGHIV